MQVGEEILLETSESISNGEILFHCPNDSFRMSEFGDTYQGIMECGECGMQFKDIFEKPVFKIVALGGI